MLFESTVYYASFEKLFNILGCIVTSVLIELFVYMKVGPLLLRGL